MIPKKQKCHPVKGGILLVCRNGKTTQCILNDLKGFADPS